MKKLNQTELVLLAKRIRQELEEKRETENNKFRKEAEKKNKSMIEKMADGIIAADELCRDIGLNLNNTIKKTKFTNYQDRTRYYDGPKPFTSEAFGIPYKTLTKTDIKIKRKQVIKTLLEHLDYKKSKIEIPSESWNGKCKIYEDLVLAQVNAEDINILTNNVLNKYLK